MPPFFWVAHEVANDGVVVTENEQDPGGSKFVNRLRGAG